MLVIHCQGIFNNYSFPHPFHSKELFTDSLYLEGHIDSSRIKILSPWLGKAFLYLGFNVVVYMFDSSSYKQWTLIVWVDSFFSVRALDNMSVCYRYKNIGLSCSRYYTTYFAYIVICNCYLNLNELVNNFILIKGLAQLCFRGIVHYDIA